MTQTARVIYDNDWYVGAFAKRALAQQSVAAVNADIARLEEELADARANAIRLEAGYAHSLAVNEVYDGVAIYLTIIGTKRVNASCPTNSRRAYVHTNNEGKYTVVRYFEESGEQAASVVISDFTHATNAARMWVAFGA